MAAVTALAAVLLGAGLIALAWHSFRGIGEAENPTSVPPTPSSSEPSDTAQAYDWVVKAMAQCEEEAKLSPDTLRFLIVPVIATGLPQPGWSPSMVGTIGQVGALLQATDTVIGLRNGALALYQGPVTFAVSDPATNTMYKWKPAVGVSDLKARQIDSTRLTLGLEIPDRGKAIEWGPTITLRKGACYWINPLLRVTNE